jgi:ABC-2 type transport system permease protein
VNGAAAAAWAICRKDLRLWVRHPLRILGSLLVPASYTLVAVLGSAATGSDPVAVVNLDHGPAAASLVRAINAAGVFRVTPASPARARVLYRDLQAAAIITIPAGLSQRAAAHEQAPVYVQADNLNADLGGDLTRAMPVAITMYYQRQGRASPVRVTVAQHLRLRHSVQLDQYSILPVIILIVTVSGLLASGMAAAGEFESRTVKPILLAPVPRTAVITGKMLAGWLSTFPAGVAMLAVGALTGLTRPATALAWAIAIATIALATAFATGAGIAIGTWWQRRQPVSIGATIAAVELFALAGGLGVIFFEPAWLQRLAVFDPLTYAIHALQQAVFYNSATGVLRDLAVLAASALASAALGVLAMRRELITR